MTANWRSSLETFLSGDVPVLPALQDSLVPDQGDQPTDDDHPNNVPDLPDTNPDQP